MPDKPPASGLRHEILSAYDRVQRNRRHWWWRVWYWAKSQTPRRRWIRRQVSRAMSRPAPTCRVWRNDA